MPLDKRRLYGHNRNEKELLFHNTIVGICGIVLMGFTFHFWSYPDNNPWRPVAELFTFTFGAPGIFFFGFALIDTHRRYKDVRTRDRHIAAPQDLEYELELLSYPPL